MKEEDFVKMVEDASGKVYIVGGWVRDKLRKALPHDKDFVVTGLKQESFIRLFPQAILIGKTFPVYLMQIDDIPSEVAFARREKKTGQGYRGFAADFGPEVTIEEDLFRRDTRINSMAFRLPDRKLIDPYGGQGDLAKRLIRATSRRFSEDPVRALRAARQAAELGFCIDEETKTLMANCADELKEEPKERIVYELSRALAAPTPSLFFAALLHSELLQHIFPELAALLKKAQPPKYHLEGDAFFHTMQVVDAVAAATPTLAARFAALVHDIGKEKMHEEMLEHHDGHENRGIDVLFKWNRRMTLPKAWLRAARFVIKEHTRVPHLKKAGKIADLLFAVEKSGLSFPEFLSIIRAAHGFLPPYLLEGENLLKKLHTVSASQAPPQFQGAEIGKWLRKERVRLLGKCLQDEK